jgi:DNA-directed RNA polymerase subunit RPC12/RpoP
VVFDTPLENIKGISGEIADSDNWGALNKVSIADHQRGELMFSLYYAPIDLIKPLIENAITLRKEEIASEKKREKIHVMLDFSFLRTYMEKGGLVLQKIKCPECYALISLPASGNTTNCQHCGSTVLAQDIYEKIKDLI